MYVLSRFPLSKIQGLFSYYVALSVVLDRDKALYDSDGGWSMSSSFEEGQLGSIWKSTRLSCQVDTGKPALLHISCSPASTRPEESAANACRILRRLIQGFMFGKANPTTLHQGKRVGRERKSWQGS